MKRKILAKYDSFEEIKFELLFISLFNLIYFFTNMYMHTKPLTYYEISLLVNWACY